jgi:hypothetical protein
VLALHHLGHLRRSGRCLLSPGTHFPADSLRCLFCGCTGVLAPDLSTVVEDTGRQRVYGCDMVLSHSAFLLIGWIEKYWLADYVNNYTPSFLQLKYVKIRTHVANMQ